jgi:alanine-glyoxylate transaminase/serine-glyoxylate transaminase/serine-pyruvate transaminase
VPFHSLIQFPPGLKAADVLPKLLAWVFGSSRTSLALLITVSATCSNSKDIVVAAGLHKDVKETYFRVGHMGVTVTDPSRGDMEKIMKGIKESLQEAGYDGAK